MHTGKPAARETILVTAAHVFERMAGDEAKLVLRKVQKDGGYARQELPLKVRAEGKPLWSKHPEADVAVLRVQLPEQLAVAPLPVACLATGSALDAGKLAPGDDVRIACYPIQLEANGAGFPIIRRGCVASTRARTTWSSADQPPCGAGPSAGSPLPSMPSPTSFSASGKCVRSAVLASVSKLRRRLRRTLRTMSGPSRSMVEGMNANGSGFDVQRSMFDVVVRQ